MQSFIANKYTDLAGRNVVLWTVCPDILHNGCNAGRLNHAKECCYHNFLLAQPLHIVLCAVTGEKGLARVTLAPRVHIRLGLGCSQRR